MTNERAIGYIEDNIPLDDFDDFDEYYEAVEDIMNTPTLTDDSLTQTVLEQFWLKEVGAYSREEATQESKGFFSLIKRFFRVRGFR